MADRHRTTFISRMEKNPPFSYEVRDVEPVQGETRPRRNIRCKDGLITQPDPSVKTAYDLITYAASKYQNARCVGTRTVVNVHKVTKMVKKIETEEWSYFELSPYKYLSYVEFRQLVGTVGAGLKSIGLEAGDKIHLYGATR